MRAKPKSTITAYKLRAGSVKIRENVSINVDNMSIIGKKKIKLLFTVQQTHNVRYNLNEFS